MRHNSRAQIFEKNRRLNNGWASAIFRASLLLLFFDFYRRSAIILSGNCVGPRPAAMVLGASARGGFRACEFMRTGWAPPFGVCIQRSALEARQFRSGKSRVVPLGLRPSPWGPLKVHNTGTRIKYKVPGHSTRCVQVRGAKCRCGVQVQGKRYRKGTRYKVHGTKRFRASFAGTAQYTPNAQARWRI